MRGWREASIGREEDTVGGTLLGYGETAPVRVDVHLEEFPGPGVAVDGSLDGYDDLPESGGQDPGGDEELPVQKEAETRLQHDLESRKYLCADCEG